MIAFIDVIAAAAPEAIAGAVVVLGRRSVIDVPAALIAVVTLSILSVGRETYYQDDIRHFSAHKVPVLTSLPRNT